MERAMVLKTTRITVETDTLMVIRRAKAIPAWCPDCRAEVDAIALGSDSLAEAATAAQLQEWLDTGKLHFWQPTDGPAQVCVPSLLQSIESEGVRTCSPSHPDPLSQLRRKSMKLTRSIANLFRVSGFVLALALIAIPIWAQPQDISQPKSFPVVISKSGSYRLTSNLVVPDGVDGIDINARDVTLDLNGFTVRGPQTCTGGGAGLKCSGASGGSGIAATKRNVTVRNGNVQGFYDFGVYLEDRGERLEDVTAAENGWGIDITEGIVSNCISNSNSFGIGAPSAQVKGTTANYNQYDGFYVSGSMTDSVAEGNGGYGFAGDVNYPKPLLSNSAAFNNVYGDLYYVVSPGNNACTNGPC